MQTKIAKLLGLLGLFAIAGGNSTHADVKYPERYGSALADNPHKWTGLIDSERSQGSGFVIRGANVVVTAAHVLWNRSTRSWNTSPTWYRKYDSAEYPKGGGLRMRGSIVNTAYASVVNNDSSTQKASVFHEDFSVCYSYTQTAGGGYGGWYNDGSNVLASNSILKLITGYPHAYTNNYFYHATGYFGAFTASFGKYYKSVNETAPNLGGNSGGPIWAESQSSPGSWYAVGIDVSGTLDATGSVGVRALDSNVLDYIDQAQTTAESTPEIYVEQSPGTGLSDGNSSTDFGSATVMSPAPSLNFTIYNNGFADLTDLIITCDGNHAADFLINASGMITSLAPGASASFSVTFTPQAEGSRSAFLRIASSDPDETPFDIAVTGIGIPLPPPPVFDADVRFFTGSSYRISGKSVFMNALIANLGAGDSGPLRLRLWATRTRYGGGFVNGSVVASRRLQRLWASLDTEIEGKVPFRKPRKGSYFMTLTLEEYKNGGYFIVDFVNFRSRLRVK